MEEQRSGVKGGDLRELIREGGCVCAKGHAGRCHLGEVKVCWAKGGYHIRGREKGEMANM